MLKRMKKLQEYLNGPESKEFLEYYSGKHFNGSITLIEEREPGTLHFEKGHVTKVEAGIPQAGVDLGVDYSKRVWDAFPKAHRSTPAIHTWYSTCADCNILGDNPIRNRQFNHTVAHVCRLYSYVREDKALWSDIQKRDAEVPASNGPVTIKGFYLRVNGIKVYVETNDAPDDKATIICLHTAGRDNRQYHDMMELFAGKYKMYTLDMPAHGKSWPLPGNNVIMDYKTYGKWIFDITKALNVENPIYIGCSMAGGIVYHMAQEYNPRAVVCMQGNDNTVKKTAVAEEWVAMLTHPGNNVAVTQRELSDSMIGTKTRQSRVDFIRWGVECESGLVKCGDYTETNNLNVSDKMDEVTCPVLIIEGTDDLTYSAEMAEGSFKRLTNCKNKKLKKIDGYGHFIIVENPEKVCEYIDELIQSL